MFFARDGGDFNVVQACLSSSRGCLIMALWDKMRGSGLASLKSAGDEAIIFDPALPDETGHQTRKVIQAAFPDGPITLTTKLADERPRSAVRVVATAATKSERSRTRRAKPVEEAQSAEKERAENTLNSLGDAVLCTDMTGRVTYLNLVAEKMTGWSLEDATGHRVADVFQIIDAETREPVRDPLQIATLRHGKQPSLTTNCTLIRRDGLKSAIEASVAPIHDRSGRVTGAVSVFHDVGKARAVVMKMSHLAHYDFLTDLPNRVLFNDRLTQAIALARRYQRQLGVLFLDCDRFKEINDAFGHNTGDLMLQSVAKRLVAAVRSSDTVSRQGGDEFVILLSELEKPEDALICARKIVKALAEPHRIGVHDLVVCASIGFAIYPDDGRNAEIAHQERRHGALRGQAKRRQYLPRFPLQHAGARGRAGIRRGQSHPRLGEEPVQSALSAAGDPGHGRRRQRRSAHSLEPS